MGYKSPRRYILTPKRKKLGKAVARGFNRSIIRECFSNTTTKKELYWKLVQLLRREIKNMCSEKVNSLLLDKSSGALSEFSWEKLKNELSSNAPTLFCILQGCTMTKVPRSNRDATIGICAAILLRFHYPKMSLVQRIISIVLYTGHSAKQVINSLLILQKKIHNCIILTIGTRTPTEVKPVYEPQVINSITSSSWYRS